MEVSKSAQLPPLSKKRKSTDTVDFSSLKKTVVTILDETVPPAPSQSIVPRPNPQGDYDSLAASVVEYLCSRKMKIDEAVDNSSKAKRKVLELGAQLDDSKEKASQVRLEAKGHLTKLKGELSGARDELAKTKDELIEVKEEYARAKKELDNTVEKSVQIAMDLVMFFGLKAHLELTEAHVAGKHVDWDLAASQEIMEKDFLDGFPHADWIEKAFVIDVDEDVESSGRTEDSGNDKGEETSGAKD